MINKMVIRPYEQIELLDETNLDGVPDSQIVEDSKFLNQQLEALIRRQHEDFESYSLVMLGRAGNWYGGRIVSKELEIDNFTVIFEDYLAYAYIDRYGGLNFCYYHYEGFHLMNIYVIESEAYRNHPNMNWDDVFLPIDYDEIFLEAFGITSEQYEIDK